MVGAGIKVKLEGVNKAIMRIDKISNVLPKYMDNACRDVAREFARSIRESTGVFSYPSGRLKKSIRAKKIETKSGVSKWGIMMLGYGPIVETGRGRGKVPPDTPAVRDWVRKAWGSDPSAVWYFRQRFHWRRSAPRPFIRPGIARARPKVREIVRKYVRMSSK